MARRAWWHGWAGVSACFVAGCLFRASVPVQPLTRVDRTGEEPVAVVSGEIPASPPVLSDYHVRPVPPLARLSAAVEPPLERVRLEVTPAPEPRPDRGPDNPSRASEQPAQGSALVAALRCAVEKHPREVQQLLERHDQADRQLLLPLLRLAAGLGESEIEKLPPREVAAALDQLSELTLHLRRRAPLTLSNLCFCRRIENFGLYEALPTKPEFQAGTEGRPGERVQVYAEVRNFACIPRDGRYETVLTSRLEIHDGAGRELVTMNLPKCEDRSRTPRQDYFLNFEFYVPARMPSGSYTLWVEVEDETPTGPGQTRETRVARRSLDFKVRPARR